MSEELAPKRGRGRPKGTGGNKRPDKTVQLEPGDNRKYIMHDMKMWDWPSVDMTKPEDVSERIANYFTICAEDDMKPSVAGMALAFGIDRKSQSDKKSVSTFERSDGKLYAERQDQSGCRYLSDEEQHGLSG